jgi:hypothetical protein
MAANISKSEGQIVCGTNNFRQFSFLFGVFDSGKEKSPFVRTDEGLKLEYNWEDGENCRGFRGPLLLKVCHREKDFRATIFSFSQFLPGMSSIILGVIREKNLAII